MQKIDHPEFYRAELSAGIVKGSIRDTKKAPPGIEPTDWQIYNLASAIEDIAKGLQKLADAIHEMKKCQKK